LEDKTLIIITAILVIGGLEAYALHQAIFGTVIAIIAGLAGYKVKGLMAEE